MPEKFVVLFGHLIVILGWLIYSDNVGSEGIQTLVDVFVSTVNLLDILYYASAVCRQGCNQQRNAGADIGRGHCRSSQVYRVVVAYDRSSVWVAQDNLGSHINQFINEEESALEHLLVNEHSTLGLCSHHQED